VGRGRGCGEAGSSERECWAVQCGPQGLFVRARGQAEQARWCKGDADKGGLPPAPPLHGPSGGAPCAPAYPTRPTRPCLPRHSPWRHAHCRRPTYRPLPSAGPLSDLHSFDPATMTWTLLSTVGDAGRPSALYSHGFTSAGGLLYVHGGVSLCGNSLSCEARIRLPLARETGWHRWRHVQPSRTRRVPSRSAPVRLSVLSMRRLEPRTRLLPRLLVRRMPCPVKFDHRYI
jgi:hypothetical protein